MKVYVFGNQDWAEDAAAFEVAEKLKGFAGVEFVRVEPNADLPFENENPVVILDTVAGIDRETVITEEDLDKLQNSRSVTAHDFDLGMQLKLLLKLGKLKRIKILGLPQGRESNYERIQSILRKLVEQDIQGS